MDTTRSTRAILWQVNAALIPGISLTTAAYGWQIVWHLGLAIVTGLLVESLACYCRSTATARTTSSLKRRYQPLEARNGWQDKDIQQTLLDGSAVLTACLVSLSLPPHAPWWLGMLGTALGLGLGKHFYGGLGQNLFNPAMVGYVIVLISYPEAMTRWALPDWGSTQHLFVDAVTHATPLDTAQAALKAQQLPRATLAQSFPQYGFTAGLPWLTLGWLIGGLFLVWRQLLQWRLTCSFLAGMIILSQCHDIWLPAQSVPLLFGLGTSTIFAAFFIVTDPVTAASTPKGQWIFGLGVATLAFMIRHFGSYPDGIAFAILLMNMCVPLIDHYTQPRIYGQRP